MMTGMQRIRALAEGGPIDRTPIGGWYHMPLVDRSVTDFTRELIASTDLNRWDFIKIMTNGHFYTEAYGGDIDFSRTHNRWNGTIRSYPIQDAEDARRLPVLGIDNPVWQRELEILRGLKAYYADRIPIVATIFNPLTAVQECAGCLDSGPMLRMMEQAPDALHRALETMTQTNLVYLDALIAQGIDGIFLANQYAMSDILTDAQYDEFCRPYEARLLEHCKGRTWFNMAHVHGSKNLRMDRYLDYPDDVLQALNWESCPTGVPEAQVTSIAQVRGRTNKILIAGIDQDRDLSTPDNDREAVKAVLKRRYLEARRENGDNRFIFAPGCCLEAGGSYLNALIYEVAEELGGSE